MASSVSNDGLNERLNELYWTSESTIDEILGQVGVTRNRLYEAVKPLPAGTACPRCGGDLIFPNRRSRLASTAICSACGREAVVEAVSREDATEDTRQRQVRREFGRIERGWSRPDRKKALIGGAAALGVVLGAAATRAITE